jgi:hypothetical protein
MLLRAYGFEKSVWHPPAGFLPCLQSEKGTWYLPVPIIGALREKFIEPDDDLPDMCKYCNLLEDLPM